MTHTAARMAVSVLAAARITRFVYQDVLGEKVLVSHVRRLRKTLGDVIVDNREDARIYNAYRAAALVEEGLDCPYCSGFWITMATTVAATHKTGLSWPARLGLGIAASYVVGHLVDRLDSPADDAEFVPDRRTL